MTVTIMHGTPAAIPRFHSRFRSEQISANLRSPEPSNHGGHHPT